MRDSENIAPALSEAAPALAVSNARRWTIVWLLFAASLINYFDRQTLSYAMPLLAKDFNLDPAQQGVLLSAFFWSYALMQIPMGFIADRVNLRWLYAGTFALWSVAQGLTGFAGSVAVLIGCRMLLGIGEAIYLVGGTKVVSLFFPLSQRGLPCGVFDAGTRTGLVLEGLIIGWMLTHWGWRTTFVVVGFAAFIWLLPWFLATPKQMRDNTPDPAIGARTTSSPLPAWGQIAALLRNRDFLGVILGFFCFDYFWYLLLTWLPSYLVNVRQLTILKAGIYAALPMVVFGIAQPLGGWLADHFIRKGFNPGRTRKTIISIAFLSGLLIIPAAHVSSPNTALLLLMGCCLVGFSAANQLVLLQECTPPREVGVAVGVYNFVGNIAGIIAPIITGYIIKASGSYTPAFVLAAVMMAASQFSYWFIVGPIPRRQ
jgi:MFS transporter, ACS family, D-galactonate transporter